MGASYELSENSSTSIPVAVGNLQIGYQHRL